jgi:hypothetical protein
VSLQSSRCGGNHTANYCGCSKWKEAKAAAAKRAQGERGRNDGVSTRLPAPKSAPPKPSPEQEKHGHGWNHVVRGGCIVKAQSSSSPTSASSDTGRTERQVALTDGQRKPACPEVSAVESQSPRSKQTDSAPSAPQDQTPLEGIADLLENLPNKARVELTRHLLSTASSLPTGEASSRAVLKTVILFIPEYGCADWDKRGKSAVEQCSDKLEALDSEDQSLWKMSKRVMRVPPPSPPLQVP